MRITTPQSKDICIIDCPKASTVLKPPKQFMVEHNFSCGWGDAGWTTTKRGKSTTQTFPSRIEAMDEIKDHVKTCKEDFKGGKMDDAPRVKDFRVVPIIQKCG